MQQNDYPSEEEQRQDNRDVQNEEGNAGGEEHDDGDTHSETPTEEYERKKAQASKVWFSGYFSGAPYVPRPKQVREQFLTEEEQEHRMQLKTFLVPRGYKYNEENLPDILNPVPTGPAKIGLIVNMVTCIVAFILLLCASCPVPWYKGKDAYKGVKFTLWKQHGGGRPTISVTDMWPCSVEKHFYQGIAGAVISGCIFSFLSFVLSLLRFFKVYRGYGMIILLTFFALAWSVGAFGMSASQFHIYRCAQPRLVSIATLDAGPALTIVAFVFLLVGFLALFFTTKLNVGPVLKEVRVYDTYFILLLAVATFFLTLAHNQTIWKRRFNTNDVSVVRVTYWHVDLLRPDGTHIYFGRNMYRCSAFQKRIKASISFLLLGTFSVFGALLCGIGAYKSKVARIFACILCIWGSMCLFVSWVTSVVLFHRTSCSRNISFSTYAAYPGVPSGIFEGETKFPGYGIQEGVIFVIIGWILETAAVIINFVIPWSRKVEETK